MDKPQTPKLEIELDALMFNIYNNEMKTITLETMKEIMRKLYKDPLVFNEKEALIMEGLKKRGFL
jgi:hypothetical protein